MNPVLLLQNRKADWPPRIVAREAARPLSAKQNLSPTKPNHPFTSPAKSAITVLP